MDFEDKKELASDRLTRLKIELGIQEGDASDAFKAAQATPEFQAWQYHRDRADVIKKQLTALQTMIELYGDLEV